MKKLIPYVLIIFAMISGNLASNAANSNRTTDRIQPYEKAAWYWQYEGKPFFLIGGTNDDNLFQWSSDDLKAQLDLLVSVGGNFVRNTMSTRDDGNALPYVVENGRCELALWNPEFWERLDRFLSATAERNIIVQLTVWDQHDFTGEKWESHFWNPENNGIGLHGSGLYRAGDFFSAVKDRNALVLPYQMKYVEKLLSVSLKYDHVLYNITNEGWAGLEWEVYWAEFIRREAARAGVEVEITTMEHGPQLSIDAVLEYPHVFSYFEISQNNNSSCGYPGYDHWSHIIQWKRDIESQIGPRPLMNEKVYGGPGVRVSMGSETQAIRRFWRIAFAGCASVRFHRPSSGLGLGETAQKQIKALRMFSDRIDIVHTKVEPELIESTSEQETYCLRGKSGEIALYVPNGGEVTLKVPDNSYQKMSLNVAEGSWSDAVEVKRSNGSVNIKLSPGVHLLVPRT